MKFTTMSEKQLQNEYQSIKDSHILISISSPNRDIKLPKTPFRLDQLILKFDDVEDIDNKFIHFDMDMAEQILTFVNLNIDRIKRIVIHCEAGISRSVAVASALSKIINNYDDELFNSGIPNMLVYVTLLDRFFADTKSNIKYNKLSYIRKDSLKRIMSPAMYRMAEYKINMTHKNKEG